MKNISSVELSNTKAPTDVSQHSRQSSATVKKALHRAIKKVGEDLERRRYNTAIATMMELVNTVMDEGGVLGGGDLRDFLKILAPFAPFMTEELYQRMNAENIPLTADQSLTDNDQKSTTISQYTFTKSNSIHLQPWPVYDPKLLVEETVEIAIQVNGKLRDTITVERQKSNVQRDVEAAARGSDRVAKYLEGKSVTKVIFIPGKLVNFVV